MVFFMLGMRALEGWFHYEMIFFLQPPFFNFLCFVYILGDPTELRDIIGESEDNWVSSRFKNTSFYDMVKYNITL